MFDGEITKKDLEIPRSMFMSELKKLGYDNDKSRAYRLSPKNGQYFTDGKTVKCCYTNGLECIFDLFVGAYQIKDKITGMISKWNPM